VSIEAKIICDSTNDLDTRLTTWLLRYPRFIHAELMTHRMFSRNASSSRAIPVKTQLERIEGDPAMFVEWGANKAGMQSTELLSPDGETRANKLWLDGMKQMVALSREMAALNVHKQIVNRIAEPWSHISVVLTGTEFANFFSLRHHPDAQPEFRVLAEVMAPLYRARVPEHLAAGEWHLPFVTADEHADTSVEILLKVSVARCARVSYLKHDGAKASIDEELKLFDRLAAGKPLHASPTEHQGTPFHLVNDIMQDSKWGYPYDTKWQDPVPWSGNLRGWFQYRQSLKNQNITTFPWSA